VAYDARENEDFMRLPLSVRGQCTLAQVNEVFELLWHHFKKHGRSA
jgi:hypothetical protein